MRSFVYISFAVMMLLGANSQITVNLDRHIKKGAVESKFGIEYVKDDFTYNFGESNGFLSSDEVIVDIKNNNEIAYTGPVIIGSNKDSGYIVYDTGSGDLTITTPECGTCTSHIYDPEESSSAVDEGRPSTLNYGSASLDGDYYEDTMCVTRTACVPDFEVFAINKQTGLDGFDGILGLSPASDLVYGLKDEGIIDIAILGYYIAPSSSQSQVVLGGYDSSLLAEEPTYFPLYKSLVKTWWWIALTNFSYKGTSVHTPGSTAIIDSGTSLIAAPYSDILRLGDLVSKDSGSVSCKAGLCHALGSCASIASDLAEISFSFGDSDKFTLSPEEYLIDGADLGVPHVCYLGFQGTASGGKYIVGDTFLRSHYAIYDYEQGRVGLARAVGEHSTWTQ